MDIPFLCIFLAFILNFVTKIPVALAMAKEPGGYDNFNPRRQQAELTGWGRRALNTHLNSFEVFPSFAVAVILAHLAAVNEKHLAILAIIFVVSRLLYIGLYLANKATLRSIVWVLGIFSIAAIFVMALGVRLH